MRRNALVWSLPVTLSAALGACSFVDDFDKFRAAEEAGEDGGNEPVPEDELDGARPDNPAPDASRGPLDAGRADAEAPPGRDAAADTGLPPGPGEAGVGPRCGDGKVDPELGEKCDDGNEVAGDGCEPKTCTVTPSQICGGVSCNDNDPCTTDVCDGALGCVHRPIDADKDGYSPGKCKAASGLKGGDCNDANPKVYPGAVEACDMLDNDCDGDVDDGAPMLRCYPDRDGDGFANQMGELRMACACPMGTIAVTPPLDPARNDCWDDPTSRGEDVFPTQTKYFDAPYGSTGGQGKRSYDYDCDGKIAPQLGALGASGCGGLLNLLLCDDSVGFVGTVAPECGVTAEYAVCSGAVAGCTQTSEQRTQACR